MVGRFKLDKKVKYMVDRPHGPRGGLVDFIDDHDDGQRQGERFLEHEISLRHGAFLRVNQQKGAVGHFEHAFDLAAEIGVSGSVDDVHQVSAVFKGAVFRGNGDAALPLKVHGIHEALGHDLIVAEHAALFEKSVDQRGFPVVDMRDNGNVADITRVHETLFTLETRKMSRGYDAARAAPDTCGQLRIKATLK